MLLATAAALVCYAGAATADIDDARSHQAEAAARSSRAHRRGAGVSALPLSHLGWAEFFLERYDDSIADLQRGIAVARLGGQASSRVRWSRASA